MEILVAFFQTVIKAIFLAIMGFIGIRIGKFIRIKKDLKK